MPLPNFVIAGAPKSGSSSLYGYLNQHPDVFLSPQKELFYFDFNYAQGIDWYTEKFSDYAGETAIGEATVWYMRWESVPERMHATIPDAKLIFLLRNPVERAYSNWCHEKRDGVHPFHQSFEEFLERPDRDNRTIISSGYYARHIKRFLKYFSIDQMHFCFTEELRKDPLALCQRVFQFLEVDADFKPDLSQKDNVSWWFGNEAILNLAADVLRPVEMVAGSNPVDLAWRKSRHFRQVFWRRNQRPPALSQHAQDKLIEHFAQHNRELSELIGPLPAHWHC